LSFEFILPVFKFWGLGRGLENFLNINVVKCGLLALGLGFRLVLGLVIRDWVFF
jgi:hypothetical protein